MGKKKVVEDDDSLVNEVGNARGDVPQIFIEDDDGIDRPYELAHVMRVRGREYAVLLPVEDDDLSDEGSALIYRVETDSKGERSLVEITSEKEFARVADEWDRLIEEIAEEE